MGPTLLSFVNENKPFAPDFGLFEIGRVCEGVKEDGLCNERKKLGIALYSRTRSEKELYMELLEIFTALGRDIKRADFTFKNGEPRHGWQHPRNTAFAPTRGRSWAGCAPSIPRWLPSWTRKPPWSARSWIWTPLPPSRRRTLPIGSPPASPALTSTCPWLSLKA